MTVKDAWSSPQLRMIVYAVLIGVAWGELRVSVAQKADRSEVATTAARLHEEVTATAVALAAATRIGDDAQNEKLAVMAADIKTLIAIQCQRASSDSFCHGK